MEIEHIPALTDWFFHGGEFAAFASIAWKVIRRLNRDESIKKDYPPHRHLSGRIIYPNEYRPSRTEEMGHEGGA